jgi:hypothetical protein
MAGITYQLIDEPIIMMVFHGPLNEHEVTEAYLESIELAEKASGPVYRVVNLQRADRPFGMVVSTLQELAGAFSGAAVCPDLAMVFVGDAQAAQDFANLPVVFFDRMDDALNYARSHMAEAALG